MRGRARAPIRVAGTAGRPVRVVQSPGSDPIAIGSGPQDYERGFECAGRRVAQLRGLVAVTGSPCQRGSARHLRRARRQASHATAPRVPDGARTRSRRRSVLCLILERIEATLHRLDRWVHTDEAEDIVDICRRHPGPMDLVHHLVNHPDPGVVDQPLDTTPIHLWHAYAEVSEDLAFLRCLTNCSRRRLITILQPESQGVCVASTPDIRCTLRQRVAVNWHHVFRTLWPATYKGLAGVVSHERHQVHLVLGPTPSSIE